MIRQKQAGYTIIEVMIFLAITAGMSVIAFTAFSGQQQRTQFAQAVRGTESQVQDWINDVNTGYFPSTRVSCTSTVGSQPNVSSAGGSNPTQGTNEACIFVGKVVRFENDRQIVLDSLAGNRQSAPGIEVNSVEEARPVVVGEFAERFPTQYGFPIRRVFLNDASKTELSGFAVVTTFGQAAGTDLVSGSSTTQVIPIIGTVGQNQAEYDAAIQNLATPTSNAVITMCMESELRDGTWGLIIVGTASGKLSTTSFITEAPPVECTA